MGQKTNPISLRININRNFDSSWFQDDSMKYSQLLHQDLQIREYLKSLFTFIGVHTGRINLQVFPKKLIIHYFLHNNQKKFQKKITFSSEKFKQLLLLEDFIKKTDSSQKKKFEEYLYFIIKNHTDFRNFRKHFFLRFFLTRVFLSQNKNALFKGGALRGLRPCQTAEPRLDSALPNLSTSFLSRNTFLDFSYDLLLSSSRAARASLRSMGEAHNIIEKTDAASSFLLEDFKQQRRAFTIDKNLKHIESIFTKNLQCHALMIPMKIDSRYKSAQFICEHVCQRLQENVSFRQIFKQLLQDIKNHPEIQGMRIVCSGRLGGVEMARVESKKYGQTSLHVFSSKIDYAAEQAYTLFGLLGVKVWLCFRN